MEEIAQQYEAEYGVTLEIQYNGSNTLLNQLQTDKFNQADVYLAADDFYTDKAVVLGLAIDTIPLANQRPVVAVRRDSKKEIATFDDLLREGVRVAVAHPDQAAIGKATRRQLLAIKAGKSNRWAQLEKHVTESGVFKPTVNDIATDVKIGIIDAAIVWNSTVTMPKYKEDLIGIEIPELAGSPDLISVAVLHSSSDLPAAYRFARFVSARDKGMKTFAKYGTQPLDGDVWEENPQVNFFCGTVNRRTTERIIEEFQAQEGVVVNTIYDGCGILTSRMKGIAGQSQAQGFPDVYMACDLHYLENVKSWFQEAAYLSDVLPNTDNVDYIHIQSPLNLAIQPIGIAKTSQHKYLLRRLFRRIENSPEAFESMGFHFRLGDQSEDHAESSAP